MISVTCIVNFINFRTIFGKLSNIPLRHFFIESNGVTYNASHRPHDDDPSYSRNSDGRAQYWNKVENAIVEIDGDGIEFDDYHAYLLKSCKRMSYLETYNKNVHPVDREEIDYIGGVKSGMEGHAEAVSTYLKAIENYSNSHSILKTFMHREDILINAFRKHGYENVLDHINDDFGDNVETNMKIFDEKFSD